MDNFETERRLLLTGKVSIISYNFYSQIQYVKADWFFFLNKQVHPFKILHKS